MIKKSVFLAFLAYLLISSFQMFAVSAQLKDYFFIVMECGDLVMAKRVVRRNRSIIKIKNSYGSQPIHIAAKYGHLKIVKYLVGNGVKPNVASNGGWQAIHFAAKYGYLEIVKYLVGKGVKPDKAKNNGWQAIHFAAKYGYLEMVKYLIEEQGVDPNKAIKSGKKPIDLARENRHSEIVKYLVKVIAFNKLDSKEKASEAVEALREKDLYDQDRRLYFALIKFDATARKKFQVILDEQERVGFLGEKSEAKKTFSIKMKNSQAIKIPESLAKIEKYRNMGALKRQMKLLLVESLPNLSKLKVKWQRQKELELKVKKLKNELSQRTSSVLSFFPCANQNWSAKEVFLQEEVQELNELKNEIELSESKMENLSKELESNFERLDHILSL